MRRDFLCRARGYTNRRTLENDYTRRRASPRLRLLGPLDRGRAELLSDGVLGSSLAKLKSSNLTGLELLGVPYGGKKSLTLVLQVLKAALDLSLLESFFGRQVNHATSRSAQITSRFAYEGRRCHRYLEVQFV